MVPLGGLVFLQAWAMDAIPLWAGLAVVGLTAASAASLTVAIRANETEAARDEYRQPTADEMRGRERRAMYGLAGVLCITMPVVGYLVDGLASAAFFLGMAVLGAAASFWWHRRFWSR